MRRFVQPVLVWMVAMLTAIDPVAAFHFRSRSSCCRPRLLELPADLLWFGLPDIRLRFRLPDVLFDVVLRWWHRHVFEPCADGLRLEWLHDQSPDEPAEHERVPGNGGSVAASRS